MASRGAAAVVDRGIVSRLVDYVYRIFNTQMKDFFDRHARTFEQSLEEQKTRGDTLEQYAVFQKYEEQLDKHMDDFVHKEGFDSVEEAFVAIDRALKTDKREHEERMGALTAQLKLLEQEHMNIQSAAMLKEAGPVKDEDNIDKLLAELDEDGPRGAAAASSEDTPSNIAVHRPQMVILQPLTQEQMLEQVLNMADYSTFSTMMRIRAAHGKQMRMAQEAAAQREISTAKRADALTDTAEPEVYIEAFGELRERICKLTPKREDLLKDAERDMSKKFLREVLDSGSISAFRTSIKKLVKFVFGRLKMLCSPNHVATVQMHMEELLENLRSLPCNKFVNRLLVYGHQDVDRIEKEIQAYMMWVSKMSARMS